MKNKDSKIIEMDGYSIIDTSGPAPEGPEVDDLFKKTIDPTKIKRVNNMNPKQNYFVTVIRDDEVDGSPSLLAWDKKGRAYQSYWCRKEYCYSDWNRQPSLDCPQDDDEKV